MGVWWKKPVVALRRHCVIISTSLSTFVDMVPPYFKPRQDFVLLVLEVCLRRVRGRREVRRDEAKSVVVTL